MLRDDQLKRLLKDMDDKADKPFYLFMDEEEKVLDSEWLENDTQALAYAMKLKCRVVNVLRWVAVADHDLEEYESQ